MSDKILLKLFKTDKNNFDENGNLKPDADLLPMYATGHKTVDRLGQMRDMQSPGSGAYRRVRVFDNNMSTDYPAYEKVGQDKVRGASAYGYTTEEEPIYDSNDPEGMFGMPNDARGQNAKGTEKVPLYGTSAHLHNKAELSDYSLDRMQEKYFDTLYTIIKMPGGYKDMQVVPMLVTAPEDAIITLNDVLNNEHDAWRDDSINPNTHEIQIRKGMPFRQITADMLDKYLRPFDIGSRDELSNFAYKNRADYAPLLSYIISKFKSKYPEYKDVDTRTLGSMLGINSLSTDPLDIYLDKNKDYFDNLKRLMNKNVYDKQAAMDDIFPARSSMVASDKQLKNIISYMYNDIPEHRRKQRNISNVLLGASRF